MTHLAFRWWPKTTSATASDGVDAHGSSKNASTRNCCGLSNLMRRVLKTRSKMLRTTSRQPSFQCRYDPLSYSLNFDTSGSGNLSDEDYYKFYSFSSRFVAATRTDCQRLVTASH
ncbi:uncharacterized protein LOC111391471 [Olea europaea var. sylvestris]|uniref:uncharacterized protein LOC111391471 n=1 Tax=Olea europaea var. sylvestris TaxID=158386 RepID=UPI000C1D79CA|nr:uncharacterized protein LOC111391471 [Olea europaea var. sylvestris]